MVGARSRTKWPTASTTGEDSRAASTRQSPRRRNTAKAKSPLDLSRPPSDEDSGWTGDKDINDLVEPLPALPASDDEDERYSPEMAFDAIQAYNLYLFKLLTNKKLALPQSCIDQWLREMNELKRTCIPRTLIAVVGATGSGKSSLINALLDQAQISPSNCMHACTAVVAEISYHDKNNIQAEVEFLEPDEWRRELKLLLVDLIDVNENPPEEDGEEAEEVCVARTKFAAVYPHISLDTLPQYTVEELMQIGIVARILGNKESISSSNCEDFATKIAPFIESQSSAEHSQGFHLAESNDKATQYWPLVKVVRIHVKSHVLATGATLVDLPGTQDTNAARSAIANSYMEKADAIWIVSPINRAVSDKVAKDLMGDRFRKQLLMDSSYNEHTITFICSKTDDIAPDEAIRHIRSLKQDGELLKVSANLKNLEFQRVETGRKLAEVMEDIRKLQTECDTAGAELEHCKQPPGQQNSQAHKYDQLCSRLKEKREQEQQLRQSLTQHRLSAVDFSKRRATICSLARNEWSKEVLRKDFRKGLKEVEISIAEAKNPDHFNPEEGYRDYAAVNLPVFCISAKEYRRLSGLDNTDVELAVFKREIDTGIPQLQQHMRNLTWAGRSAAAIKAIELLQSLTGAVKVSLQTIDRVCSDESEELCAVVAEQAARLVKVTDTLIETKLSVLKSEMIRALRHKITEGFDRAQREAVATVEGFATMTPWNTYRATMIREGVYKQDLNELLVQPIIDEVAYVWKNSFEAGARAAFTDLPKGLLECAEEAFDAIEERAPVTLQPKLQAIRRQQQEAMMTGFKHLAGTGNVKMRILQKGLSRQISPDVRTRLSGTYLYAANQSGPGVFKRMKDIMQERVSEHEHAVELFGRTSELFIGRLDVFPDVLHRSMKRDLERIVCKLRNAYGGVWERMEATPEQKQLRRAVRERARELGGKLQDLMTLAKESDRAVRAEPPP